MSKDETIVVDGPRAAARILSRFSVEERERLVESIRVAHPASAMMIEEVLLSLPATSPRSRRSSIQIEQITELEDRTVQRLLREVPLHDVVMSLKKAPTEVQEKILTNMSQARQQQVIEDARELPKMPVDDVEAAQQRILKKLDELYPEGTTPTPSRRLRSRLA